jgi:hypothetical protein
MPVTGRPGAVFLGGMLRLQGALHATTDERKLARAVVRGLESLPGLVGCAV